MKYRCDMVRDLMPLCLDHEASESSEQTVIEHLAECKECTKYYDFLGEEIDPIGEQRDEENEFVKLASKMRKRRRVINFILGCVGFLFGFICCNYANGYRLSPKAAADLSGRLNDTSQVISCYEWKDDFHFYIYDSYSCYDVVYVEKSPLGWKKYDNYLNWPKWSVYEENVGIETAGALCHYKYDEGVQLFPVRVYDDKVKSIEVTCFEQTQTKEVTLGEVILFTFDAVMEQSNKIEATAYDAKGNAVYYMDERHIWVPVEE